MSTANLLIVDDEDLVRWSLRERLTREGKEHVLRTYAPEAAIARFLEIYDAIADHQPHR